MDKLTFDALITTVIVIGAIWASIKMILEIVTAINKRHDMEEEWSAAAERTNKMKEDIMNVYQADQERRWKECDKRIEGVENKIESTHMETEAKMQQMMSELCLLTYAVQALLDGQIQQGCNGNVTAAKKKIDKHLNTAAHGVEE